MCKTRSFTVALNIGIRYIRVSTIFFPVADRLNLIYYWSILNTAMNAKILRDSRTISLALLSSLLVVAVTGGIGPQEAKSQNATTTGTANQTGGATTQNQTGTALENLTRSDFEPVTSAMNSARDWITGNSTQDAYSSLNDAENVLFRVAEQEGPTASSNHSRYDRSDTEPYRRC